MKICPGCEAELKDSVIRCTRCGRVLREELEREPVAASMASVAASAPPLPAAPLSTSAPAPARASARAPAPSRAPSPRSSVDSRTLRALPRRRARGPDWLMLLAGLGAMLAGVLAYMTIERQWVHLSITRAATDTEEALLTALTLRGHTALVGTLGSWLAIAIAVLGLIWFFYGFQKGWTIPSVFTPAIGWLVTIAGAIATVLASMVWFVWEDAMVAHAAAAGLSTGAMRELVHLQPAPLVEIERLPGLATFGLMMGLGFLASCLAWTAYRRRD